MPLSPSTSLGRYEILSTLGAGGMGEVYLANDARLNRQIALKILPENIASDKDRVRRFEQEAQTASALNHPNILTVYEIGQTNGQHFIAMEFIEGETLRRKMQMVHLEIIESLSMATQIADALDAAHRRGIVHRDIKPENIMVREDGLVKVLDFGLAKLAKKKTEEVDSEAATRAQVKTEAGMILGTVAYMSPEQARGAQVDARTDIFSFGVMLYEMLAGCQPFTGETMSDTLAAILKSEPAPLSQYVSEIPKELERIVGRTLRKNADERYQHIKDLLIDLRDLKEGLEFTAKLERSAPPKAENATAILQATTGDASKQTATTQRSFSQKIVNRKSLAALTVFVALLAGAIAFYQNRNPNQSPSVQDLYLQGRFYSVRENQPDNDKAIQLLEQAVALDPNHAQAHAQLARAYGTRYFFFEPQQKQWEEKSYVELEKAFALAPDLAEAYEVRGLLLWTPGNRFPHDQAIAAYRRALALNPNLNEAHHQLGVIYFHIGLFDEALTDLHKAMELNPGNTLARFRIGVVLNHQGQYEEALRVLKSSPPDFNPALIGKEVAWALISLGRHEEAAEHIAEMLEKYPKDGGGQFTSLKALRSALSGDANQAEREIRDALEKGKGFGHFHHAAYNIACAYAVLNKPDEAVRYLQMAAEDGYPCYPLFASDLNLNAIRQNPKFQLFLSAQKRQWEYYKLLPKL